MDEQQTLYCYKLNGDTGAIVRYEIPGDQWALIKHKWNRGRDEYRLQADLGTGKYCRYGVRRQNVDKFLSCKIYTFNPDESYAINIITETIASKLSKAQAEVNKYNNLLDLIEKSNPNIPIK